MKSKRTHFRALRHDPCQSTWLQLQSCKPAVRSLRPSGMVVGRPRALRPVGVFCSTSTFGPAGTQGRVEYRFRRSASCGRRKATRNRAHSRQGAASCLDLEHAHTRINTSCTNKAIRKTKIILTCSASICLRISEPSCLGKLYSLTQDQGANDMANSPPTGTNSCSGAENSRGSRNWIEAWKKHGRRRRMRARSSSYAEDCACRAGQVSDVANWVTKNSSLSLFG